MMRRDAALNSVSIRNVDLPPPDTPVTHVKVPSGKPAVTFFRLLPRAPTTLIFLPLVPGRRSAGTAIPISPERYWPVRDFGLAITSAGVPWAITSPPWTPAAGP